jgi:hypothetical protein
MWSAQPLLLSGRRKATLILFNTRSTLSVRFFQSPMLATLWYRSYSYTVLINSRKLRHYFDQYKIYVVTNYLGHLFLGIGVQNTDIHYLHERKKAHIHTIVFGKRTKQFVVRLLVITHVSDN